MPDSRIGKSHVSFPMQMKPTCDFPMRGSLLDQVLNRFIALHQLCSRLMLALLTFGAWVREQRRAKRNGVPARGAAGPFLHKADRTESVCSDCEHDEKLADKAGKQLRVFLSPGTA